MLLETSTASTSAHDTAASGCATAERVDPKGTMVPATDAAAPASIARLVDLIALIAAARFERRTATWCPGQRDASLLPAAPPTRHRAQDDQPRTSPATAASWHDRGCLVLWRLRRTGMR